MYLEWYMTAPAAVTDVARLRRSIPSANFVRLVGVLWKDSVKESDGIECSTDAADDSAVRYMNATCLRYLDALLKQATDAGLWVVLTARAKYAAGWAWPAQPDVFHDGDLRQRFVSMWEDVAARYASWDRVAGYEIMSEPRTKVAPQSAVMQMMADGCAAVRRRDPHCLCIVGPAPYYKLWELRPQILLPKLPNVVYTFDFFVPWHLVTADSATSSARFPAEWECNAVYDTWWPLFCTSASQRVMVDAAWLNHTITSIPAAFQRQFSVPVYCNQWGVKGELFASRGRLAYAEALLSSLISNRISSSYWIWRSMQKGGRPFDQPVWGFELVHDNGSGEEGFDEPMAKLLQRQYGGVRRRS